MYIYIYILVWTRAYTCTEWSRTTECETETCHAEPFFRTAFSKSIFDLYVKTRGFELRRRGWHVKTWVFWARHGFWARSAPKVRKNTCFWARSAPNVRENTCFWARSAPKESCVPNPPEPAAPRKGLLARFVRKNTCFWRTGPVVSRQKWFPNAPNPPNERTRRFE